MTPEQNQYIVLKKRSRTKLVLNADSEPEFDGWLKTLLSVTERLKEVEGLDKNATVESNLTCVESERGRSRTRGWGKAPVPTPRSKTPSREDPPVPGKRQMEVREDICKKIGHCHDSLYPQPHTPTHPYPAPSKSDHESLPLPPLTDNAC